MTGQHDARRRGRRLIVAGVLLLAAGLAYLFTPRSTAEIEAVADGFAAPSQWELLDTVVHSPTPLCFGETTCPFVGRSWSVPGGLTAEELDAVLARSGWDMGVDGTCAAEPGSVGERLVCSAAGTVDGYAVAIRVRAAAEVADARLRLDVEPS
jgi:hypothetical protein